MATIPPVHRIAAAGGPEIGSGLDPLSLDQRVSDFHVRMRALDLVKTQVVIQEVWLGAQH